MVCKGFLFFAQGEYDNSEMYFSNISDIDKGINLNQNLIILAKIGRGLNSYNKGNYNKALEYFISLIREYDCVNENVLECLALCYYNLGILNKSKAVFLKIIELNPSNYRVLTYLSILTLVTSAYGLEDYQVSFQYIKDAFVNDEESEFHLLLIQLANIFLLAGKVSSAEEISMKLNHLLEFGEMRSNTGRDSKIKGEKYRRDIDEIKSSIYCISAKILHYKKNNNEAFSYYIKAVQSNPKNIEAQFGLGQIYLSMQNMTEAEKCFLACKSIQEDSNSNSKGPLHGFKQNSNELSFEIIKYLAYISSKTRRKEVDATIEMYKKALEIRANDTDCYIELAQLLDIKKPEESLKYYEELMILIKTNKNEENNDNKSIKKNYLYDIEENMPEILINIATLKIRLQIFSDIEKLLNEAKTLVKNRKETLLKKKEIKTEDGAEPAKLHSDDELMNKYRSLEMAINFNLAIYYESNYQFGEAYKNYKELLKQNPYFIEAYIKLGLLAKLRGNKPKAIGYMKQALDKHFEQKNEDKPESNSLSTNLKVHDKGKKFIPVMRKPINPLLIMAQINYDMSNESEALSILSNILKTYDDKDPYTLVLLGNIYYDMASLSRNKSSDFYSNLNRSLELYHRALEADKYNAYAAMGIANVLSEYNLTSYALETYKITAEKFPNNHNAFLNEALIYMNDNKFEKASIILTKLLKKHFKNKCPDVENLLAKSLIEMKDFDKAMKVLKGLILRHPDNIFYKFNYALCLKQHAEEILNKPERRVKETEEAIKYLEISIPMFESILILRKEINHNLTEKQEKIMKNNDFYYKCHELLEFLKLYLSTARQILEKDRLKEREIIRKIEENKVRYLKMLETQKEMDERQREEIHKKMKENEKLAESYKHIADQIIQVTTKDEKESKKHRKKKEKSFDDFVDIEKNYRIDEEVLDYSDKHEKRRSEKKHKKNSKSRERNSQDEDLMEIDDAYANPNDIVEEKKKHKKLKKRRHSDEEEIDFFGNFNDKEEQGNLEEEAKQDEDRHQASHSIDNPNITENYNVDIKDVEMKDYTKNELDDELDFS